MGPQPRGAMGRPPGTGALADYLRDRAPRALGRVRRRRPGEEALHEGWTPGRLPDLPELQGQRPLGARPVRPLRLLQEDDTGEEGQAPPDGDQQWPTCHAWYLRVPVGRRGPGKRPRAERYCDPLRRKCHGAFLRRRILLQLKPLQWMQRRLGPFGTSRFLQTALILRIVRHEAV